MPTNHTLTRQLQARVDELETENRALRQRVAWAVMRMRDCTDKARRALGELEAELLLEEPAA